MEGNILVLIGIINLIRAKKYYEYLKLGTKEEKSSYWDFLLGNSLLYLVMIFWTILPVFDKRLTPRKRNLINILTFITYLNFIGIIIYYIYLH